MVLILACKARRKTHSTDMPIAFGGGRETAKGEQMTKIF
jgi:hypothetical protein